jgi:c-di-AMP phosphodiesterase-like protein
MSKWIANNKKRVMGEVKARRNKLQAEKEEYEYSYRDFPYERYYKAINRRGEEIEELDDYIRLLSGDSTELDDYKDAVKQLRALLGKISVLANYIEPCDRISDDNLKKLMSIVRNYRDDFYDTGMFESQAKHGNW